VDRAASRLKARAIDLYRFLEGAGAVAGAGIGTVRPVGGSPGYGQFLLRLGAAPVRPVSGNADPAAGYYRSVARGCRGSYSPTSPPPGRCRLVRRPHRASVTAVSVAPLAASSSIVVSGRRTSGRAHAKGAFGGVHGDLGGRKLEDRPVGSDVDIRVVEHFPKEGTIGFGVVTVDDDVGAVDHGTSLTARGPGAHR
jgi:hypothetical protein